MSHLHDLLEAKLPAEPDQWIRQRRDDGLSWEAIARILAVEYSINVTGQTLRTNYRDRSAA